MDYPFSSFYKFFPVVRSIICIYVDELGGLFISQLDLLVAADAI